MPLAAADLSVLSRLLDQALDLPPGDVEPWLAKLPHEQSHLVSRLREMLAQHLSGVQSKFMADGPKLLDTAPDDSVARVGELVGPYRLIRKIGHGGMGAVWLAEKADGSLKRNVALKLPRLAWGTGLTERMARERDIGALLEHPNIARLYDAGVDSLGRPYLALEYVDGQPLDEWCEAKALSITERLRLFLQVTRAVTYAHGRLVVHRDLKPSNVLISADGQAHLLDFGIAKLLQEDALNDDGLTQAQGRVLSPQYASPEQVSGAVITVGSDVYSLGVLLYELLAGQPPYRAGSKSLAALEAAVLEGEPSLASNRATDKATAKALRGELDAILSKALKREPDQRYATADAFAQDIERYLNGERVLAQPDSIRYRLRKIVRKNRGAFAAAGAILIAVLGGAGVSIVQAKRANDAAERARVVKEFVVDVFKVNVPGSTGNSELRQLPAELLLQHGAKLIETKFPGQPQLQAELFGVVGGIFANMGANELAASYATHQVETLVAIAAGDSDQAQAMMLLAEALLAQGRLADAELRARRALVLAQRDSERRPGALVLLARVLAAQGRWEDALRALGSAEYDLKGETGPTALGAHAKQLRARFLSAIANRFDEALPMFVSAIEEALLAEGPLSPIAIEIRLSLAGNLRARDRPEEARPHRESALAALRAAGGAGEIRAAMEESDGVVGMFMQSQMTFDEAKAVIERNRSLLASKGPLVPDSIKAWVDFDLGAVYIWWGDLALAEPLIIRSVGALMARTEIPFNRFMLASYQHLLDMYAGRHDQAHRFARQRHEERSRMQQSQHPFAAYDYVFEALNFSMAGRFDEAETVLASAPILEPITGAKTAPLAYRHAIETALASVKLDRGDPTSALSLLPPESEDQQSSFHDVVALRGEILCALGRHGEGLALLDKSLEWREARNYEYHPGLASVRAVAGLCALAMGQRKRALELATLARAAFTEQPEVSPYFKAPLLKLEQHLRMKQLASRSP